MCRRNLSLGFVFCYCGIQTAECKSEHQRLTLMEKDEATISQYTQGLSYLLSCFSITNDAGDLNFLEIIIAAYRGGCLQTCLASQIFKETKSFQCKVHNALTQAVEWLLLEFHKNDMMAEARVLELLKRDVLAPMKKQNAKKRKIRTIKKKAFDFDRLQKLPPVALVKETTKKA
jgi:hypothetical protein